MPLLDEPVNNAVLHCLCSLQDDRLQECMVDLRGKFKAVVVMMGLKNEYFTERPGEFATTAF